MARFPHNDNGVLELNLTSVSIKESQCQLSETDFPDGAEVGTIVSINKPAGEMVKPVDTLPKALLCNSEVNYNQYYQGLKDYKVPAGATGTALYMRDGTKFTTNTFGSTEFATDTDLTNALKNLATTPLYAKPDADGILEITTTPTDCAFAVVKFYTVPDGQPGAMFLVINEGLLSAIH